MKEKTIEVEGISYTIREMLFIENLEDENIGNDRKLWAKNLFKKCVVEPKLSDEDIEKFGMRTGTALLKEINILNGFTEDFHSPSSTEEQS